MLINVVCLQGDRFSDTLLAGLTFSVFTLYKSMSLCQRQTAGFDGEFIFLLAPHDLSNIIETTILEMWA